MVSLSIHIMDQWLFSQVRYLPSKPGKSQDLLGALTPYLFSPRVWVESFVFSSSSLREEVSVDLASAGTGLVCPDLVPGPISLSGLTLSSGLVNGYLLYDGALVPAQGLFVSITGTHCCALPARLGTLFFSFLLLMLTWTPLHFL